MSEVAIHYHHPIVEAFIRSEKPLIEVLRGFDSLEFPEASTMLQLMQAHALFPTNPERAKEILKNTDASYRNIIDPNLSILFLSQWCKVCLKLGLLEEASLLMQRQKVLLSYKTPLEIQSEILLMEGILGGYAGNMAVREKKHRESLELLHPNTPVYAHRLIDLGNFMGRHGRLMEIETEHQALVSKKYTSEYIYQHFLINQFVNSIETGQMENAIQLLESKLQNKPIPLGYKQVFILIRHSSDLRHVLPEEHGCDSKIFGAKTLLLLLQNQPEKALENVREEWGWIMHQVHLKERRFHIYDPRYIPTNFLSYNFIRAELSNGHGQEARDLIQTRHDLQLFDYMDDFFLARAEKLLGHHKTAAEHFARVISAVRRYKAEGRLDIEIKLSHELSLGDVPKLYNSAMTPKKSVLICTPDSHPPKPKKTIQKIIGTSKIMEAIRLNIERYAPLDIPVLIRGETGTGKELIARALHEFSPRRKEPFMAINCSAISESILESELFGHVRGAFTGANRSRKGLCEEAGKGTLFLDEIGDISARLQLILLRLLEEQEIKPVGSNQSRKIKCRILFATNANLEQLIKSKKFRSDLYYRLDRLLIDVPPLRDRPEDIPLIAEHFFAYNPSKKQDITMTQELCQAMMTYSWPGNVRELKNTVERIKVLHPNKTTYEKNDFDLPENKTRVLNVEQFMQEDNDAFYHTSPSLPSPEDIPPSVKTPKPPTHHIHAGDATCCKDCLAGRLKQLRRMFQKKKKLTRKDIINTFHISPMTASRDLNVLIREGFIQRIQPTPAPRTNYFILKTAPQCQDHCDTPRQ